MERRPNRKKRRFHPIRFGFFIFIISILIVLCTSILAEQKNVSGDDVFSTERTERQTFVVNEGDTLKTVSVRLKKEGLIENDRFFMAYVKENDLPTHIRTGSYRLSPAMPLKKIAAIVTRPQGAGRTIVIRKGSTIRDVQELFEEKDIASKKEFYHTVKTAEFEGFNFISPPGDEITRLEGFLFPGKYEYEDNMNAEEVLSLMLENFATHYNEIPKKTNDLSDRDTVILASMLEKEARSDGEKPSIASVYINRLHKDMPLQCDATILYDKPGHVGAMTFADYEYETPYNTYLHKGFPPSPICNPSMTSLIAAANPARTDYYFYLFNTQTQNAHVFAKTYEEHLKNREIYGYDG